ncbi:uncharacterized protein J3R85_012582 [Psidium guajava]|nr:uncharacterized protein J3R85_012582 [Psidium guajava]
MTNSSDGHPENCRSYPETPNYPQTIAAFTVDELDAEITIHYSKRGESSSDFPNPTYRDRNKNARKIETLQRHKITWNPTTPSREDDRETIRQKRETPLRELTKRLANSAEERNPFTSIDGDLAKLAKFDPLGLG